MEKLEIYNSLKSVPIQYTKKITGGRLNGMTDIKPQWRIMKMTETFGMCGIGWKIQNLKYTYINGSDNQIVCSCYLELCVRISENWSDAIIGVGGSMFITKEKNGMHTSDEAEKMAYTDALSVAMKMLGMGADIYLGLEPTKYSTSETPTTKQKLTEQGYTYLIEKGSVEEVKKALNDREVTEEQKAELQKKLK